MIQVTLRVRARAADKLGCSHWHSHFYASQRMIAKREKMPSVQQLCRPEAGAGPFGTSQHKKNINFLIQLYLLFSSEEFYFEKKACYSRPWRHSSRSLS